jgi:DNA-binding NtrC family response regulator
VDYIAKPWDDQKLISTVANLMELGESRVTKAKLKRQDIESEPHRALAQSIGLIYQSGQMQRTVDMALQVAKSEVPVLITGPNGAGKEKIAELVHEASVLRKAPFIKVNCGALPSNLIEAELFGAEAGAYTGLTKRRIGRFEAADGGTLFLDEIGNLPHEGQVKLLRVLQTGEFERLGSVKTQRTKVRLISATNANLFDDIGTGAFREDLYYRLNVINLDLAPLDERVDDIMPLAKHFLPEREFSYDAEQALLAHSWPGNVRELENACKRLAVLKPEGVIDGRDFSLSPMSGATKNTQEPDKESLEKALRAHKGVIARVAREFGMSRQALYRRLVKFGIDY